MNLAPGTVVPPIVRDFRRIWPQLLAAYIVAGVAIAVIVTPATAIAIRLILALSGNTVVADLEILEFALSPIGLASIIAVAGLTVAVGILSASVLAVIAHGASGDRQVGWLEAIRFVAGRHWSILRLAIRVVTVAAMVVLPVVVVLLVVYERTLTEFDIYFYVRTRPPEFVRALWIAGVLGAIAGAVLLRLVIGWTVALPRLLFDGDAPGRALSTSRTAVDGHRRAIGAWLVAWAAAGLAASAVAAALIVGIGRLVIPQNGSLTAVAATAAAILSVNWAVTWLIGFVSSSLLMLLIVRLYALLSGPTLPRRDFPASPPLGERAQWDLPRLRPLAAVLLAGGAVVVTAFLLTRDLGLEDRVEIAAHRGFKVVAPENTLAAMEAAIAAGADWVELDVQETADGTVVVLHDRDLMRVGGIRLEVHEATMEKLAGIDVGSWFDPEFASQRVPTLDQVLALCKDRIRVIIELKYYGREELLEERVIEAVERHGMEDEIVLMSLSRAGIDRARALRPGWKMGLLNTVAIGDISRLPVEFLAVNASVATAAFIRRAQRRGRDVFVWTVDDPVLASSMMSRGVDVIITGNPLVIRSVLAQRAEMNPVERLLLEVASTLGVIPHEGEPSTEEDA